MRLLFDTHALLWWLDGDPKLSPAARTAMRLYQHSVLVVYEPEFYGLCRAD